MNNSKVVTNYISPLKVLYLKKLEYTNYYKLYFTINSNYLVKLYQYKSKLVKIIEKKH